VFHAFRLFFFPQEDPIPIVASDLVQLCESRAEQVRQEASQGKNGFLLKTVQCKSSLAFHSRMDELGICLA